MTWITKYYFDYWNKSFWCYEPSVGDYYLFIKDPEYFIEKKLTEWWKPPKLTQKQTDRFLRILFDTKENDILWTLTKPKKNTDNEQRLKDIHIWIAIVSRATYLDAMSLPLEMFWKILEDLEIIVWKKEYDPKRKSQRIDSEALKNFTWWKKTI